MSNPEFVPLMPAVETVIHSAGMHVEKVPTPDGVLVIIKFITPAQVFTLRIPEEIVEELIAKLRGGVIVPTQGIVIP